MEPVSDRELLIRMDERLTDIHEIVKGAHGKLGLVDRVDSLESDRDKFKALAHLGGGGGIIGLISAVYHFFKH